MHFTDQQLYGATEERLEETYGWCRMHARTARRARRYAFAGVWDSLAERCLNELLRRDYAAMQRKAEEASLQLEL